MVDFSQILGIIVVAAILWFFLKVKEAEMSGELDEWKVAKRRKREIEMRIAEISEEIERKEAEVERTISEAEFRVKVDILMKLKMSQLKAICTALGLGCPSTRRKDELVEYMASKMSLDQVKEWAWKYKVASREQIGAFNKLKKSLLNELERFKAEKEAEIEELEKEMKEVEEKIKRRF
ncbi:hypothetical protein [Pyrococcus kukulkanii]|uniref:SAP domain-containing protein n=1 Tax=Pyrococcus kukulkanii TaxID=1609559 RepID=A0A127B7Y8_9EURY|nr:hypothetical protein [Pyrococcus kukulkanii]AMM53502.1 hypothetical protein TQ32_02605 [Pyrococcus kukulkanii]